MGDRSKYRQVVGSVVETGFLAQEVVVFGEQDVGRVQWPGRQPFPKLIEICR